MRYIIILLFVWSTLFGVEALRDEVEFTQPDGTTFYGYLKGDSAFHWIESNGEVIVYNPKDKFYYKATVDKEKGLIPTNMKVGYDAFRSASEIQKEIKKTITKEQKEALKCLYKKAKTKDAPR